MDGVGCQLTQRCSSCRSDRLAAPLSYGTDSLRCIFQLAFCLHVGAMRCAPFKLQALPLCLLLQVSLPTQYNGKNQDPVGALSSTLARLQARAALAVHACLPASPALCCHSWRGVMTLPMPKCHAAT